MRKIHSLSQKGRKTRNSQSRKMQSKKRKTNRQILEWEEIISEREKMSLTALLALTSERPTLF